MQSSETGTAPSVIVMPESDEHTLCLTLTGTISKDEYEQLFSGKVREILERHRTYGLLLYYAPGFQGWSPDAAAASMEFVIDAGNKAHKLAYVNPSEKKIAYHKLVPELFSGETRFFDTDELDQAIIWVKTVPPENRS